jgi:vacuolar-type H+-ATPase subunit H
MEIKILLVSLIFCCLANNGFAQSTPKKLGEITREQFEKAKDFVSDSTGPVKKVIKETGEKAKEVWKNIEPQREAAAEKAKELLKKTEEAAKEFKEGWQKDPKK